MDKHYSFSNFTVHDGNRFAYQMTKLVVQNTNDELSNLLTIFGPPGCGKTHLLMALANKLSNNKKVHYLTGRDYLDLFFQTIKPDDGPFEALQESFRKIKEFRNSFGSNLDVLILDQAEDLAGYECTAIELSIIAERLVKSNKQVVFAFNQAPECVFPPLDEIAHPLVSLLKTGCIVEIWDPTDKKGVTRDDLCSF